MFDKKEKLLFYMDRIKHIEYQQAACMGFYFAALAYLLQGQLKYDLSSVLLYGLVLGGLSIVLCHIVIWGLTYAELTVECEGEGFAPLSRGFAKPAMRRSFYVVTFFPLLMTPGILMVAACKAMQHRRTFDAGCLAAVMAFALILWYFLILWAPMRDLLRKPQATAPKS